MACRLARPLLLLASLLSLLVATTARAETDDALAKQYYKLGEELYNRADYEGALKQFNQSYLISKRPALLYNMARCHESLGQHEKAIEVYNDYLRSNPENPAVIQARIANLKRLIEKRKEATPVPTPTPAPTTAPSPEPSPAPTPAPPVDTEKRPLRWPGWITLGAGGAMLVTGLALGLRAKTKESQLEDANAQGLDYLSVKKDEDAGRALSTASIALTVAGGVAAATGAVLLILDARRRPAAERRAWLLPVVAIDGWALTGGLRF
jgi:tetratricopeptide (TPR) repeat protein